MEEEKREYLYLGEPKEEYYQQLDEAAQKVAEDFVMGKAVSLEVLRTISFSLDASYTISWEILNRNYRKGFDCSFPTFISIDVEYYIARILYHIAKLKDKNWKIVLKKEVLGIAPDIRVVELNEKEGEKTIAILDINVKEWARALAMGNLDKDLSPFVPDHLSGILRGRIDQFVYTFKVSKEELFVLLPTAYIASDLIVPKANKVVFSESLEKEIYLVPAEELQLTSQFEFFLNKLLEK